MIVTNIAISDVCHHWVSSRLVMRHFRRSYTISANLNTIGAGSSGPSSDDLCHFMRGIERVVDCRCGYGAFHGFKIARERWGRASIMFL